MFGEGRRVRVRWEGGKLVGSLADSVPSYIQSSRDIRTDRPDEIRPMIVAKTRARSQDELSSSRVRVINYSYPSRFHRCIFKRSDCENVEEEEKEKERKSKRLVDL